MAKTNGAAGGPAQAANHPRWYAGIRLFGSAMKKKRKLKNSFFVIEATIRKKWKRNNFVISGHKGGKSVRGFPLLSIFDFGTRQILFLQDSIDGKRCLSGTGSSSADTFHLKGRKYLLMAKRDREFV